DPSKPRLAHSRQNKPEQLATMADRSKTHRSPHISGLAAARTGITTQSKTDGNDILDIGVEDVGWKWPAEDEKALQFRIARERHHHAVGADIERSAGQA